MDVHSLVSEAGGVVKLAARLGISYSTVSCWKRAGFIPGSRLVQLSKTLDIPVEQLSLLVRDPYVSSDRALP